MNSIYSFNKHILSAFHVLDTIGAGDRAMTQTKPKKYLLGTWIWMGETEKELTK